MKMSILKLQGPVFASLVMLSSCTSLPSSGPATKAIDSQALVTVSTQDKKVGIDYALIDLSKAITSYFPAPSESSLTGSFGARGQSTAPEIPLGIGDVVSVSVFESQAGGLFIPSDAGSRAGNFITVPQQTIDRGGTITVPYAGRIKAAGRSKEAVEKAIEDNLANRAIEPQVVVTVVSAKSSQVAVLGAVTTPAKIEVGSNGERVLDIISSAGGITSPSAETAVTLSRKGKTAKISYDRLSDVPSENIFVMPGDTVFVDRTRRTFVAFGASGTNGRYDFEESGLSLAEGLGKAGGLLDARADPGQVFLYRMVDRKTLEKAGVDTRAFKSDKVPTIFRANMRDPGTFFATQNFAMQDKDLIYISNADSVELTKFLDILNSVTSTASGVSGDVADTRQNIRDIN
jgi:polysaccharide export outer membrane protein